jgi:uncharacterized delta-60 repeat protein
VRVTSSGSIDLDFEAYESTKFWVRDFARQDDGKLVVVGGRVSETSHRGRLVVRRLNADGSIDSMFANHGVFMLPSGVPDVRGKPEIATSVIVDPEGRIVVAGLMSLGRGLLVIRLLPDGELDESFASSGVFYDGDIYGFNFNNWYPGPSEYPGPRMLRTSAGGYRVTGGYHVTTGASCLVVALTANGALDRTFGDAGVARVSTEASCHAIAIQPHGGLIVAGHKVSRPFVMRLFANGESDPNFTADRIAGSVGSGGSITALSASGNAVVAAVYGKRGTAILRLRANGELDPSFGDAGASLIDLASDLGSDTRVHDVRMLEDGSILAAGGDAWADQPFAVRLLGPQGGVSGGVLGVARQGVLFIEEEDREILVEVRRTGGASGRATVRYRVQGTGDTRAATAGEDFVADAGRLEWNHGDRSSRQIRVRILDDAVPEEFEYVQVLLSNVTGRAGLGTRSELIEIRAND